MRICFHSSLKMSSRLDWADSNLCSRVGPSDWQPLPLTRIRQNYSQQPETILSKIVNREMSKSWNSRVTNIRTAVFLCHKILTANSVGLCDEDTLYLLQNINFLTLKFASSQKYWRFSPMFPQISFSFPDWCRVFFHISFVSQFTNVLDQTLQIAAEFKRRPVAVY